MHDHDEVGAEMDRKLRLAITIAAQIGERLAVARRTALEQARQLSQEQQRRIEQRIELQRRMAHGQLQVVHDPAWWDSARAENVAHLHETAVAWRGDDPVVQQASDRIREEVANRWGFDIERPGLDARDTLTAVEEAARERVAADRARAAAVTDADEAQLLLAQADELDKLASANRESAEAALEDVDWEQGDEASIDAFERAEAYEADADANAEAAAALRSAAGERFDSANQSLHSSAVSDRVADDATSRVVDQVGDRQIAYDSVERRAAFEASLREAQVPQETINARLVADRDQARPATQAVSFPPANAPKARKASPTSGRQRETSISR